MKRYMKSQQYERAREWKKIKERKIKKVGRVSWHEFYHLASRASPPCRG